MDSQDGDFEVTAEMLIHGDLDDESTLSEEEDIEAEDSDEIDELQTEGEIPLEELLSRYGYGGGSGPSGVRGGDSDSGDSVRDEDLSVEETQEPGTDHKAVDTSKDSRLPDSQGTSQTGLSSSAQHVPSSNDKELQSIPNQDPNLATSSTTIEEKNSVPARNVPGPTSGVPRSSNHTDSEPVVVEEETSILGKRPADPVINDVTLNSKQPALMTETDEATGPSHWIRSGRLRRELPDRRATRFVAEGSVVDAYFNNLLEDSDLSDDEFMPILREEWKQEIKVGSQYQASVPDLPNNTTPPTSYGTTPTDVLMWRPREASDEAVPLFLESLSQTVSDVRCDSVRDSEEALEVLENCDHNVPSALEKILTRGLPKREMEAWTESECQSFEEGLRQYGKDFFRVQKQVPTRTVRELVEFYYLWKKSERYDLFVQRYGKIGRKKIAFPPGHVSDFMNKYFDIYSTETPDIHYAATTISADAKRENT